MTSIVARIQSVLLRRPIQILSYQWRSVKQRARSNPGIDRRLRIFKREQPEFNKRKFDEKNFDDLEEDLNDSVHLTRIKYEKEVDAISKKIQFKQVERKHFSGQKWPNMLLWAEKEQIRYLVESDPDLWTNERLCESFPVTPAALKKLLKSQWKPESDARIQAHDKSVAANWHAFEMGKFNFPESFARHLKTFTSKKHIIKKPETNCAENMKLKAITSGEFSDIIRSYNARTLQLENKLTSDEPHTSINSPDECDITKYCSHSEKKLSTNESSPARFEVNTRRSRRNIGVLNERNFIKTEEPPVKEIELSRNENYARKIYNEENVAMKIEISKDKWKKGCLYRVNNCYYTDDGEFLYRV